MRLLLLLLLLLLLVGEAQGQEGDDDEGRSSSSLCFRTTAYDASRHKSVYKVGVLAIRGKESAYKEFNKTFSDFLSETAGQRFDPPIAFEMVPLDFVSLFEDTDSGNVDFLYVNPSAFSCIESEHDARSLVSQISLRNVQGNSYNLRRFGGVIITRADNHNIHSIHDLRDKVIAAASISGLGSGQMQFRAMQEAGLSYINDPKQLIFTSDQGKVVNGVLSGRFDVGFVRTDQVERTVDAEGKLVNKTLLKVIDPLPDLSNDGVPFPFQSSTPLYPEWNLASMPHVAEDMALEVQNAMLHIADHSQVASALYACDETYNQTYCDDDESLRFPLDFNVSSETPVTCDITRQSARIARAAMTAGKYSGWTTTLSYMQLRSMQQSTGFIERDQSTNVWRCIRSTEIYGYFTCPAGLLKNSRDQIKNACSAQGLECEEDFQCICQPCYKPTDCIDSVEMLGRCVSYSVLLPSILVPFAVISLAICLGVVSHKSAQIVKHAKQAAVNEFELNEFIA